jgi:glycerol-3-phosphate acyltransferase PlsX
MRIAIDAMGGDFGLPVVIPAVCTALQNHPDLHLVLVGDNQSIRQALDGVRLPSTRLTIRHAPESVQMDEVPSIALRTKKDSSMRVAIEMVRTQEVMACVSAGNTGALMAMGHFVLRTIPGIARPAIVSEIPTLKGSCLLLDSGANIECTDEYLYQFGLMGSILRTALTEDKAPKVALLNIGAEHTKGTPVIKRAAKFLGEHPGIRYIGYIEGHDIFKGLADVVICDGFVGNVALKTTEGVSRFIQIVLKEEYSKTVYGQLMAFLSRPVLATLKRRFDPRVYNGAVFLGLNGVVIKSHGAADALAFSHAITQAVKEIRNNVIRLLSEQFARVTLSSPMHLDHLLDID